MTIACYDQDKIIKYNGLIILLAQPKNKTMFIATLSNTHTHTVTHTRTNRRHSLNLPRSHTNAKEKMFLSSHFFLRLTLFTESFVDELHKPFTPCWNRLEKLIPKM